MSEPIDWPYLPPMDDDGARHLVPGTALPDLDLPAHDGTRVSLRRLTQTSVLFIYPWTGRDGLSNPPDWDHIAGAHGSTPEAAGFRDLYAAFQARGYAVFGLSGQDGAHHRELAERLALPFPLLSDAAGAFRDALALPTFETGGVRYLTRLTLLIADGAITRAIYPVRVPPTHAANLLAHIDKV